MRVSNVVETHQSQVAEKQNEANLMNVSNRSGDWSMKRLRHAEAVVLPAL
jgi:hypothetical protein